MPKVLNFGLFPAPDRTQMNIDAPSLRMTPIAFIAKWHANVRNERAASQEHFLDLCALLDEPTPNSDPTGAAYAFEKGATKASGGEGWGMSGDAGGSPGSTKASTAIWRPRTGSSSSMPAHWRTRRFW